MQLEKDQIGVNKSAKNILESFTSLPKRNTSVYKEPSVVQTGLQNSNLPNEMKHDSQLDLTAFEIFCEETRAELSPESKIRANKMTFDYKTENYFTSDLNLHNSANFNVGEHYTRKTDQQIRIQYLRKLTYSGIWLPPTKHVKSHQNLFILDWDDTLLPTSFFMSSSNDGGDL